MADKPTYEKLESIVKELKAELVKSKQAEKALLESEQTYKNIFNYAVDSIFIIDSSTGSFIDCNEKAAQQLGYTKEEILKLKVFDINPAELHPDIHERFKRQIAGESNIFETTHLHKDGHEIPAEITSTLFDVNGRKMMLSFARYITGRKWLEEELRKHREDLEQLVEKRTAELTKSNKQLQLEIEERKQVEEALRENKEKFNAMLQSIADHMSMMDKELNIIWANETAKKIFGNDIIGRKCFEVYHKRNRPCEPYPCLTLKTFQDGKVHEHYTEVIDKNGEIIYFHCTANLALRDKQGKPKAVIEISRDITDQKRTEEKTKKLKAQLQMAQKMEAIATLAGGIAHVFNNLLMSIQGNTSLMLIDIDSLHPHYERLKSIEKQIQSGAKLTGQLLGYASKGKYEVKPISLNQIVNEISDTFGQTRKEVVIHRKLAEDLLAIEADQGQIEQVLLNLFVNAADAMPGGGDLILEAMNVTHKDIKGKLYDPKAGIYIMLIVKDTGMGMDKSTMERIFDPFFTTKEMGKGTGLGLASVYGIIKAHGGYIDVESRKKHGTTFRIYMPASKRKVRKITIVSDELIKETGTVLLVDDEEVIQEVCKELLENIGYRVFSARDGKEALKLYRKNQDKIDLVLLDMTMPNMSGSEVYNRMKEINPDIKVLLSSGYSIDGEATDILKRGCNGFIQKPFNLNALSQKIRKILEKK